jgi:hypothetical protein
MLIAIGQKVMESDLVRQPAPVAPSFEAEDFDEDEDEDEQGLDEDEDFDELELAKYVQKIEAIEGLDVEEALSMGLIHLDDIAPVHLVEPDELKASTHHDSEFSIEF